jgi:murein DD-endopeptidase MepM/ murein hydrolase activator NlpD
MLAPTGTPIYAVVSGTVTFKQNRLGGNAVSLAATTATATTTPTSRATRGSAAG